MQHYFGPEGVQYSFHAFFLAEYTYSATFSEL